MYRAPNDVRKKRFPGDEEQRGTRERRKGFTCVLCCVGVVVVAVFGVVLCCDLFCVIAAIGWSMLGTKMSLGLNHFPLTISNKDAFVLLET